VNQKDSGVTSSHYSDARGQDYFAWQNRYSARSGVINSRKFKSHLNSSNVVLDYGCGSGDLLDALDVSKKIGIEINPFAMKSAMEKDIKVFSDLSHVADSKVDAVISNHALEHVPYPLYSLKEIHRVLNIGGKLLCCIPVDDWRFQKEFKENEINNHLHTWTPQLVGNLLVESGFNYHDISIKLIHHSWFPGTKFFWKRERLFDVFCYLYSKVTRKGKQIMIVAKKT
jgi:ubiquinone/menaquinone biosynthesis C-methylase UbiE